MTGYTTTEKILRRNDLDRDDLDGGRAIKADVLLTHDVCGPGTIGVFKKEFGKDAKVWDPGKVVIIPDHYIYTCDEKAARNRQVVGDFAREQGIRHLYDEEGLGYRGVCHVALPQEGHVIPGEVIFGTDSHTCAHGNLGAFASGIGNTYAGYVLGSGHLIMNAIPKTMQFRYDGKLPDWCMGKDLILDLINRKGTHGADFRSLEFIGDAITELDIEERNTICNMGVEMGATNAIIPPDKKARAYAADRSGLDYEEIKEKAEGLYSDEDAEFAARETFNASLLEPMVAMPHSPGNGIKARKLDQKLDRAYIGGCTGGKNIDFLRAAALLCEADREVVIPLFLVPATTEQVEYIKNTRYDGIRLEEIFWKAGANMGSIDEPSCAACLGGPKDTYGRADIQGFNIISTTNRNFPDRMGKGANVFLASPLTAIASALTGKVTDPRRFMI